ncbi:uncharacterized protein LOC128552852 [Mercenaria mercenaria]|uniref:uncharacterized protein LOC128552852 n=1 Tax=Mercenaria mercenaria TaxID=6596 RepID=UPI00234E6536|nr:uncharacterized protein LOC128552852 [Mercenaria mercenaria]
MASFYRSMMQKPVTNASTARASPITTHVLGLFPIPNGTCVFPCEEGSQRDVHDDFQCKELRWVETDSSLEEMKPKDNDLSQKAEEAAEINKLNKTSQKPRNETKTEDSRTSNDSHVTIVIVFASAALLLAIVGLVSVLLKH